MARSPHSAVGPPTPGQAPGRVLVHGRAAVSTLRLLGSYGSVMDACGLTVAPSRLRALAVRATTRREVRPVPPRRGIIRPTSTGLRIRLRLAPGQEPADVAASAERLRHAWGVHAVYVEPVKPGVVELRLVGFDVLRQGPDAPQGAAAGSCGCRWRCGRTRPPSSATTAPSRTNSPSAPRCRASRCTCGT